MKGGRPKGPKGPVLLTNFFNNPDRPEAIYFLMFYLSMASVTGAVRITTIDERLMLTELKRFKPQYAPYLAAIQAASNQFVGPMGFLAYGIVGGHIDARVVNDYIAVAKPEFDAMIIPLGVSVQFSASPTADFQSSF